MEKNKPPIPRRSENEKGFNSSKKLSSKAILTKFDSPVNKKAKFTSSSDRLSAALLDHDLTTAVEVLEELGYHDQSTQVFLLGWFHGEVRA